MTPIENKDGWWWPADDVDGRAVIDRDFAAAVGRVFELTARRGLIVQAGGNVGVYPVALAGAFARVLTFEPDETNFNCLVRNLQAHDADRRVTAMFAALGEDQGVCSVEPVRERNCGAHRAVFGEGSIPVWALDRLPLMQSVDVIWLDIEGAELLALKGARAVIERDGPLILAEDKGLSRAYGDPPGALAEWLGAMGYAQVDRVGQDKVFRRS